MLTLCYLVLGLAIFVLLAAFTQAVEGWEQD
jgi:hypothetical protein